ncbi:hypothetical protein K0T92_04465 [Paenibacillus oenotherae]|uniref:Uncharacterized protein n=1 Tax=Paenibacillus oenotherae TaxID=1435645 RepID=A0ABS7D271_9BACL|nr:hypothetical protein [Paenibacillus oenotherae]MBW7473985.1 hypothetical protein [Paenibacillus oenotherae]
MDEGYREREESNTEANDVRNKPLILEMNREKLKGVAVAIGITEEQSELASVPQSVEKTIIQIAESSINKMATNFD